MKPTHRDYLVNPLEQLKNINTKLQSQPLLNKDLLKIKQDLLKLLQTPILKQAICLLITEHRKTKASQQKLANTVLDELELSEKCIRSLLQKHDQEDLKGFYFEPQKNVEDSAIIFKFKSVQRLIVAHLQVGAYVDGMSFLDAWILNTSEFNKIAVEFLRSTHFVAWEQQNLTHETCSKIMDGILNIWSCDEINTKFGPSCNPLALDIQTICTHFIASLVIANELATLKIKKIWYEYNTKTPTTRATLKLFINTKKNFVIFHDENAALLKIMLDHPLDDIELDEFDLENAKKIDADPNLFNGKSKYDRYYRKVEAINQGIRLSKNLHGFSIEYFLVQEGYSITVYSSYQQWIVTL